MHDHQIMLTTRVNLRTQQFYVEANADRLVREARRNKTDSKRFLLLDFIQCFRSEATPDQEG